MLDAGNDLNDADEANDNVKEQVSTLSKCAGAQLHADDPNEEKQT